MPRKKVPKPEHGGVKKTLLYKTGGGKFLGKDPWDTGIDWSEDYIQMYIVQEARKGGYLVVAGCEQAQRNAMSASRNKAMGMTAGNPDLTWMLENGKVVFTELKTLTGRLSDVQTDFHSELKKRGHDVYTIYAKTPGEGWELVQAKLRDKTEYPR